MRKCLYLLCAHVEQYQSSGPLCLGSADNRSDWIKTLYSGLVMSGVMLDTHREQQNTVAVLCVYLNLLTARMCVSLIS